jgi:tetratricopeptide (TPR) repeat protein
MSPPATAKWIRATSRAMHAVVAGASLPMQHIFSFVPLPTITRCLRCSRHMHLTMRMCALAADPAEVVACVDRLVAARRMAEAEKLLRPYIARNQQYLRTRGPLLNRYILLLHSYVWPLAETAGLRQRLWTRMKGKAMGDYQTFALQRGQAAADRAVKITAAAGAVHQAYLAKTAALVLRDEKRPAVSVGDKFAGARLDAAVFRAVSRAGVRRVGAAAAVATPAEAAPVLSAAATAAMTLHYLWQPHVDAAPAAAAVAPHRAHRTCGEATCLLAYFLYKDGQMLEAVRVLDQAAVYDPDSPLRWWVAGVLQHYHFQDFAKSCVAYGRAIAAGPDFAYPCFSLAVLLSDGGDVRKAEFLYRRCFAVDPRHHYALMNRAIALPDGGAAQLGLYRHVMAIHPLEMYVYRATARALLARRPPYQQADPEDVAEAERVLRLGIAANPRGGGSGHLMDLAFLYVHNRNDYDGARPIFAQFIQLTDNRGLAAEVQRLVNTFPPAAAADGTGGAGGAAENAAEGSEAE